MVACLGMTTNLPGYRAMRPHPGAPERHHREPIISRNSACNVVGDRKDIYDKLMRMLTASTAIQSCRGKRLKPSTGRKESSIRQIAWRCMPRQRLAIRPQACAELFDRSAGTNGSSSSILTGFFGTTTSSLRRLRETKKALKQLQRPCQDMVPVASPGFRTWQAAVISDPISPDDGCQQG